jgi:uncharacterized oxidoreductase
MNKMKMSGNTILITGGATGIGFALTEAFLARNNDVIVCARTKEHLREAQNKLPKLRTRQCDLSKEKEIESLYKWVSREYSAINILVNNAGIQRMIDFTKGTQDLFKYRLIDGEDEITINFKAYVYLASYFIPDFLRKSEAAIVNVSSGLGFVPMTIMPVYSATKAAIHSFSVSLRHQLRGTSVKIFEIIPPTVDTNLDKGAREARGQKDRGIPPVEVATAALAGMEKDQYEIGVGMAQNIVQGSRNNFDQIFANMNR